MIKYILLILSCQAQLDLYLLENEGYLLHNLNKFYDYNARLKPTYLKQNDSIISLIQVYEIKDCLNIFEQKYQLKQGRMIISTLYLNNNNTYSVEVARSNHIYTKFINQIQPNEFSILSKDLFISPQKYHCLDHLFSEINQAIILICQQVNNSTVSLISHRKDTIYYTDLQIESRNDHCKYQFMNLNESIYLISCIGTNDWAINLVDILRNQITLLANNKQLQIKESIILTESVFCDYFILLFNNFTLLKITGERFLLYEIKIIDKIISVNDHCYLFSQQNLYKIDVYLNYNQKTIVKEYPQYLHQINTLNSEQLQYLDFNQYIILYNSSHLIISNQYIVANIENIFNWNYQILSIFSNQTLYFYQIQVEQEIIYMNQNQIQLFDDIFEQEAKLLQIKQPHILFFTIEQFIRTTQYGIQNTVIKTLFPITNLTQLNQKHSLSTQIQISNYTIPIPNEIMNITNKQLCKIDSLKYIWIVNNNKTIYLFDEINHLQDQKENINQLDNREVYKFVLFELQTNQTVKYFFFKSSLKTQYYLLVLQNLKNFNITLVQFQYSSIQTYNKTVTEFNFNCEIDNIKYHNLINQFSIQTKEKYYLLQIEGRQILKNQYLQQDIFRTETKELYFKNNQLFVSSYKQINLIKNYLTFEDGIQYENIFEFEYDQFILIYQTFSDLTLIQHYYVSQYNSIILLKNLPFPNCTLLYPYRIKSNQPRYFSIEALDELTQQNVILLYDISYPQLYCLRYKTILKSNQYILSEDGHIVFIYENEIEFIIDDELRIQQNLSTFDKRKSIHQLIQIKQENLFLTQTLSIKLEYLNNIQTISLSQNQITIEYQQNQQIYELPIQQISEGEIHQVEFEETSQTNYQLTKPIEVLFNQNCDTKIILQLNSTHFITKSKKNLNQQFLYQQMHYNETQNKLDVTTLDQITNQQHSYIALLKLNLVSNELILMIDQLQDAVDKHQYQLSFYNISLGKFALYQMINIRLNNQINNIYGLANNKIIINSGEEWIIYQIQLNLNQIKIHKISSFTDVKGFQHYKQNEIIYFYQVFKHQILIYEVNDQFLFEIPFKIIYDEDNILDVKLLDITGENFKIILQSQDKKIVYIQYIEKQYYYYYIMSQYTVQIQFIELISNLLFIPFIYDNNFYFLYKIQNQKTHQIIYPFQKLIWLWKVKFYEINNKQFILQTLQNITVIQTNSGYQLQINELQESIINIILKNLQFISLVQIIISKKVDKQNYLLIIITFLLIILFFSKIKTHTKSKNRY